MRDPVARLLDDVAAAGREGHQDDPRGDLARSGHVAVPPTLRCQECGRRLELRNLGDDWWWAHDADSPS